MTVSPKPSTGKKFKGWKNSKKDSKDLVLDHDMYKKFDPTGLGDTSNPRDSQAAKKTAAAPESQSIAFVQREFSAVSGTPVAGPTWVTKGNAAKPLVLAPPPPPTIPANPVTVLTRVSAAKPKLPILAPPPPTTVPANPVTTPTTTQATSIVIKNPGGESVDLPEKAASPEASTPKETLNTKTGPLSAIDATNEQKRTDFVRQFQAKLDAARPKPPAIAPPPPSTDPAAPVTTPAAPTTTLLPQADVPATPSSPSKDSFAATAKESLVPKEPKVKTKGRQKLVLKKDGKWVSGRKAYNFKTILDPAEPTPAWVEHNLGFQSQTLNLDDLFAKHQKSSGDLFSLLHLNKERHWSYMPISAEGLKATGRIAVKPPFSTAAWGDWAWIRDELPSIAGGKGETFEQRNVDGMCKRSELNKDGTMRNYEGTMERNADGIWHVARWVDDKERWWVTDKPEHVWDPHDYKGHEEGEFWVDKERSIPENADEPGVTYWRFKRGFRPDERPLFRNASGLLHVIRDKKEESYDRNFYANRI